MRITLKHTLSLSLLTILTKRPNANQSQFLDFVFDERPKTDGGAATSAGWSNPYDILEGAREAGRATGDQQRTRSGYNKCGIMR